MLASTPTSMCANRVNKKNDHVVGRITRIFEHSSPSPGTHILTFEYTPDGSRIVTLDYGNRVEILNASNGALVRTILVTELYFAHYIAISPDNSLLAILTTARDQPRTCYLYDLNDIVSNTTPVHQFRVDVPKRVFRCHVVFTPTRQLLIEYSYDESSDCGFILVPTRPTFSTIPLVENDATWLEVSPNGAYVVVYKAGVATPCRVLQTNSTTYVDPVIDNISSIDNHGTLTNYDSTIDQWQVHQLVGGVYKPRAHRTPRPIYLSPSGLLYSYLAPASLGATLFVCRLADDTTVCSYYSKALQYLNRCEFSANEQSIVIGLMGRGICMFDIATRQLTIYRYDIHARDARFSPTNTRHRVELHSRKLISYEMGSRDEVRRIGCALIASQTRQDDREQMRRGIGAIVLDYIGCSRLVDMSTFAEPNRMTTRSMKRKHCSDFVQ